MWIHPPQPTTRPEFTWWIETKTHPVVSLWLCSYPKRRWNITAETQTRGLWQSLLTNLTFHIAMSGLGNTLAFVTDDVWGQRHSENNRAAQSWGILHQQIYRRNHLMTSPNNGTLPYQFITSGLWKEGRWGLCRTATCRWKKKEKKKEYSKHEHQTIRF